MAKVTVSKALIEYLVNELPKEELTAKLKALLTEQSAFVYETADFLANSLESIYSPKEIDQLFLTELADENLWQQYIAVRLTMNAGKAELALQYLAQLNASLSKAEPALLLLRARLLVRLKSWETAASVLKQALEIYPAYPFFVKAEKLVTKVMTSNHWMPKRKLKVALLGSHTTELFAPVLVLAAFREDIEIKIYQGLYGNFYQEVLNPVSGLYSFQPDVVIFLPSDRDLPQTSFLESDFVTTYTAEITNLWMTLQEKQPCHIIQVGLPMPPYGPGGSLEDSLLTGRGRMIYTINQALAEKCGKGVSYFDMNRVAFEYGSRFYSPEEWYIAKQYPAGETLPFLADCLVAQIKAVYGLTAKVLVLDLDNTLWGGVIGEDGLGGIRIGSPSPEGEGYEDLQCFAKGLKQRGVLLAVCSKNNEADAKLPFEEHDSMILRLDDFVVFKANWQDKATNIREIAETLSLGLDSFVFLDDNPLERAWVREKLPMVRVPECGSRPWEMLAALRRSRYFEAVSLTKEDKERHESYKANVERQAFQKNTNSLADFLTGLSMKAECGFIDANTLVRAAQLINKTNQFNLTAKRYTEEQVKEMAQSPDWWCRWYRLSDRFGDHGLIGILLAKREQDTWLVDTWLMSCRVLGRQMEEFMCCDLLSAAKTAGALTVRGLYIQTPKNGLVKDLYERLGFQSGDTVGQYTFSLQTDSLPECGFIKKI